jgi:broad specificity phosphatase PhoE
VARAANALRFALARHPDDTIVLVGHDSVNRALLMQLIDQPLSAYWRIVQSPCCLNEIDADDGRICVQRVNETGHLEALAR